MLTLQVLGTTIPCATVGERNGGEKLGGWEELDRELSLSDGVILRELDLVVDMVSEEKLSDSLSENPLTRFCCAFFPTYKSDFRCLD